MSKGLSRLSLRAHSSSKAHFERLCLADGRSMNEVLTELMRTWVDARSKESVYWLAAKWLRKGKLATWMLSIQIGTGGPIRVVDCGQEEVSTIAELQKRISETMGNVGILMAPGSSNGDPK
jgi:hypothetical protein